MNGDLRRYLISHHIDDEYYRCSNIRFGKRNIYVCTRCSGWYISFILFWIVYLLGIRILIDIFEGFWIFWIITPAPAIIDWGLYRFGLWKGTASSRFFTGLLIGIAFATVLYNILIEPLQLILILVIGCYVSTVIIILFLTGIDKVPCYESVS